MRFLVTCTILLSVTDWLALPQLAQAEAEKPAPITATFEEVGQVCLSDGERERLLAVIAANPIPEGATLTVVGYSDSIEMKRPGRSQPAPCVSQSIPAFLKDHERIAVLRALHVVDAARNAGLVAFARSPVLLFGSDDDYVNGDPHTIAVLFRRSQAAGSAYRKVEVRWVAPAPIASTEPSPSIEKPTAVVADPPVSVGQIALTVTRPRVESHSWRRVAGWTLLGLGVGGLGAGGSFLIAAGVEQWQSGQTLDINRSVTLDHQAHDFWQAGGWATGLGVGLTAAGIILLKAHRR